MVEGGAARRRSRGSEGGGRRGDGARWDGAEVKGVCKAFQGDWGEYTHVVGGPVATKMKFRYQGRVGLMGPSRWRSRGIKAGATGEAVAREIGGDVKGVCKGFHTNCAEYTHTHTHTMCGALLRPT